MNERAPLLVGGWMPKKTIQQEQRRWLHALVKQSGMTASGFARRAGLSSSTITRFLHSDEYSGILSQLVIQRICEAFNVPGPDATDLSPFALTEADQLDLTSEPAELVAAIRALSGERQSTAAWRLNGRMLEAQGYLPDDVLIVDENLTPRHGDAVCAHVTGRAGRGPVGLEQTETVFRLFVSPFLVASTAGMHPLEPPIYIDHRVTICGVVIASVRTHRFSDVFR